MTFAAIKTALLTLLLALAICPSIPLNSHAAQPRRCPPSRPVNSCSEHVEFNQNGQQRTAEGRVVVEAADGGILLQTTDGALCARSSVREMQRRETARRTVQTARAGGARRTPACPNCRPAFAVTPRRIMWSCYNTSRDLRPVDQLAPRAAVQSVHQLLGRPGDRAARAGVPAAGVSCLPIGRSTTRPAATTCPAAPAASSASTACGRIASTCSTSPASKPFARSDSRGSMREINQMLSQPAAVPLVATVVHEATHQIAFNCGLQAALRRYPAVAVRRDGRVLRGARPHEHPRLARHRPRELPAARNVSQKPLATGTTARSKNCSATAAASATRARPSTPTPTPGR